MILGDEKEPGGDATEGTTTATETTQEAPNQEIETEAREMGWKPQSEWKGKPDDWKDAGTWVARGKEILPIVSGELKKSKAEVAELRASLKRLETMGEKTLARELERQRVQLTEKFDAQKREAVRTGDEEAYDKADKAQRTALKDLDETAKDKIDEAPVKGGLRPADKTAMDEWMGENSWFKESAKLRRDMDDNFDDVSREMPGASMADKLAEARARTVSDNPGKFGRTAKPARNAVEGGSRGANGGSQNLASKLNAVELAQADKDIAKGKYKNRQEWATVYFEDDK